MNLWLLAKLGVPGIALIVFCVLLKKFEWRFPPVPKNWVAPIVILFISAILLVVMTALVLWAPKDQVPRKTSENSQDQSKASLNEYIAILEYRAKSIVNKWRLEKKHLEEKADDSLLPRIQALEIAELQFTSMHAEHVKALQRGDFTLAHEHMTGIFRFMALVDQKVDFAASAHYAEPQRVIEQILRETKKTPSEILVDYTGPMPLHLECAGRTISVDIRDVPIANLHEIDLLMRPAFPVMLKQLAVRKQRNPNFQPGRFYK